MIIEFLLLSHEGLMLLGLAWFAPSCWTSGWRWNLVSD